MRRSLAVALLLVGAATTACGSGGSTSPSPSPGAVSPSARDGAVAEGHAPAVLGAPAVLAADLEAPWGLAFLPDGSALVSQRDRRTVVAVPAGAGASGSGAARTVATLSGADSSGEGGLLGLAVAPTYAADRYVYAYYTTSTDNRIVRFRLGEPTPSVQPLVTGIPRSGIHNGGRLAFGPDGMLYAGTGDASQNGRSQDRSSLGGKILRLLPDGRPAPGNPFPDAPLVFTDGHRNVQGLTWDTAGRLWASEFGQDTYDEVNRITPGGNYGWPTVEGAGHRAGFTDPLLTWSPADASPSGVAYARGSLWVAALRGQRIWRVDLDGRGGVAGATPLQTGAFGRLRHVALAPDGRSLWVLTSNRDGRGRPAAGDDRVLRFPLT